jgi:uncharacterized protein (DUF2461 family)
LSSPTGEKQDSEETALISFSQEQKWLLLLKRLFLEKLQLPFHIKISTLKQGWKRNLSNISETHHNCGVAMNQK